MPSIFTLIIAAIAAAPVAMGHTWIEQLRNVNEKGEYVGEYGYPRGMVAKTDKGYSGTSMNNEMPGATTPGNVFITKDTLLCHESQRKQEQSQDKYPRLQATPGGFIAMRYTENGHVSLPQNQLGKPKKGGTIFVYGTTSPKEDEHLVTVLSWTQDGQGGDKRGKLLAMNDFDDGRCYETNSSPISLERQKSDPNFAMGQAVEGAPGNYPLSCETNVQLPDSAEMGKPYTIYWVWQWNTAPGKIDPSYPNGKDEYYSTCIDVDVASKDVAMAEAAEAKFNIGPQQDAMTVAVADFASRTALMTDVVQGEVGPIFSGGLPAVTTSATDAAPLPTGSAPVVISVVPSISSGAPFLNSTLPAPTDIPTLSGRPGAAPTSASLDSVVTVTNTVMVTVTEPAATHPAASATTPRAVHSIYHKNGAKFRGL
ncbi:hypothetical protein G6011_04454 [Alternaria panax]|uniref:DUF7492 domain-containing protein n=1 Tax=Alternaria panax TaxID=48097 RepID=A0AAD4IHF6_9PLEO|nr:hypothetical protein G6011_04454 [Alternaria panax]